MSFRASPLAEASVKPCPAHGCAVKVGNNYWLCPRHWRLVPRELRQVIRESFRSWDRERTREAAQAALENGREVLRILVAIEAGVPA